MPPNRWEMLNASVWARPTRVDGGRGGRRRKKDSCCTDLRCLRSAEPWVHLPSFSYFAIERGGRGPCLMGAVFHDPRLAKDRDVGRTAHRVALFLPNRLLQTEESFYLSIELNVLERGLPLQHGSPLIQIRSSPVCCS